jgi:hypothetical protein
VTARTGSARALRRALLLEHRVQLPDEARVPGGGTITNARRDSISSCGAYSNSNTAPTRSGNFCSGLRHLSLLWLSILLSRHRHVQGHTAEPTWTGERLAHRVLTRLSLRDEILHLDPGALSDPAMVESGARRWERTGRC